MLAGAKRFYNRLKEAILREVLAVKGLMQLLMKRRNTEVKWTKDEKAEIQTHLKSPSKTVPMLLLFSFPGGSFLVPLLALALDRRRGRRAGSSANDRTLQKIAEN
jgi:hypothetical protein